MGAFFLYHKSFQIKESQVENLYLKKGFKDPVKTDLGDYLLISYKKQNVLVNNYFQNGSISIFTFGSFFYKDNGYLNSLISLLADYEKGTIDFDSLYGNYLLIFHNSLTNEIKLFIDPAFIKTIYYNQVNKAISTDFLCLIEAFPDTNTFNEPAFIENLTTGNLISPDTYINEIQKVDKVNFHDIPKYFPGIEINQEKPNIYGPLNNCHQAIEDANHRLSKYFSSSRNISNENGSHIGLTGGFDSRLLLMHARKHIKNLITNSFYRPNSPDYINAKELGHNAQLEFISFEKQTLNSKIEPKSLEASYYFFDGQIRSQNNWDEQVNTSEYALRIASGHLLGFHGCGGEQYRNTDRVYKQIYFKNYLIYDWLFRQCKDVYINSDMKSLVYKNIEKKIKRLIGISKNSIGLLEIKKIQNEVWNTSNRNTRLNTLNQLMFYFAPFTEYQLSYPAYTYVPCLGKTLAFQIKMMKDLDADLCKSENNYGIRLIDGEALKQRLIPYFINNIPRSFFYRIFNAFKNPQTNVFPFENFISQAHPYLIELQSKVDLKTLSQNKNLGNALFSYDKLLKNLPL